MASRLHHKMDSGITAEKKLPKNIAGGSDDVLVLAGEKEKLKAIYSLTEREIRRYAKEAVYSTENPAKFLLRKIETRLDNVIFRIGYADSRLQAQGLIFDGKVMIDGGVVGDPSYHINQRDIVKCLKTKRRKPVLPSWLEEEDGVARLKHLPLYRELKRKDVDVGKALKFYVLV